MTCQNYRKVAFAHTGDKSAIFTRLRCKQWACEYCAQKNANMWRYWLSRRLPEVSENWALVTLTAHEHRRSQASSLENIRPKIDTLMKRVKRCFGDPIEYVRVYEKHPTSDAIHAHLLIAGLSPYVATGASAKHVPMAIGVNVRAGRNGVWACKTWFKKTSRELGMGYMADVSFITGDVGRGAHYICKYLTKSQQDLNVKHLRHVQVSKGVGSPVFEGKYEWEVATWITSRMFAPGAKIVDLDTGFTIDNNFWESHYVYPHDD